MIRNNTVYTTEYRIYAIVGFLIRALTIFISSYLFVVLIVTDGNLLSTPFSKWTLLTLIKSIASLLIMLLSLFLALFTAPEANVEHDFEFNPWLGWYGTALAILAFIMLADGDAQFAAWLEVVKSKAL